MGVADHAHARALSPPLWRKLEFAGLTGRRQWWRNLSRLQRRGGFDVTFGAARRHAVPVGRQRNTGHPVLWAASLISTRTWW